MDKRLSECTRCRHCFEWRDRTRDVITDTDFILAVCRCDLKVGVSNTSSCLLSFSHCSLGFPHGVLFTSCSPSLPPSWCCGLWRWSYCLCVEMDGWTRSLFLEVRRPHGYGWRPLFTSLFSVVILPQKCLFWGGPVWLAVSFTPCQ